jgi:hypothetical protein
MTTERITKLNRIYTLLIRSARDWAARQKFDSERAADLRRQAIEINHSYYFERIPAYRRLAQEEGVGPQASLEQIKQHMLLSDGIFKSYDQSWLDANDFSRMNAWLSEIYHQRVEADMHGVQSIDTWIDRLDSEGIKLVYSSGTSGTLSFVPRDTATRDLFRLASTNYLIPLITHRKVGTPWQYLLVRLACQILSPDMFGRLRQLARLSDYDAVFLDFSSGKTGNQAFEQDLAPSFRRHTCLYETNLSPSLTRLISRRPSTEAEVEQVRQFQELVIGRKAENYLRLIWQIKQSIAARQKTFIFGTTHQYKELCELMVDRQETLPLQKGSLILFGGGWKLFTGTPLSREQLTTLMSDRFQIPAEMIVEGYSMSEMNAFTLRCEYGRFHIPPVIEPLLLDEALNIQHGPDLRGTFAFLDPLALAYSGFIISGDEVHWVEGECPCGLTGPAVTEIGRARAREAKGCGGIMASVAA